MKSDIKYSGKRLSAETKEVDGVMYVLVPMELMHDLDKAVNEFKGYLDCVVSDNNENKYGLNWKLSSVLRAGLIKEAKAIEKLTKETMNYWECDE